MMNDELCNINEYPNYCHNSSSSFFYLFFRKGTSLIELTMVMTLMILFGLSIFTIISSGAAAQKKINADKETEINARIAMSYVTVKIRQNDEAGKIIVEKNPVTGLNSLVIRERTGMDEYDKWIFYYNNGIYEFWGLPDQPPSLDLSFTILENDGLNYSVDYDRESNSIINKVEYDYGGKKKELSTISCLRSGN